MLFLGPKLATVNMSHRSTCGWCRTASKDPHEYLSHTIDVCPLLASVICGHCQKQGHTTKHCKALKRARRHSKPRARVEGSLRSMTAKFAKQQPHTSSNPVFTSKNPFELAQYVASTPPSAERFECEKCGFQHSCLEMVEAHEENCFGQDAAQQPHLVWADCESDDEIDSFNFDDNESYPQLP